MILGFWTVMKQLVLFQEARRNVSSRAASQLDSIAFLLLKLNLIQLQLSFQLFIFTLHSNYCSDWRPRLRACHTFTSQDLSPWYTCLLCHMTSSICIVFLYMLAYISDVYMHLCLAIANPSNQCTEVTVITNENITESGMLIWYSTWIFWYVQEEWHGHPDT